MTGPFNIMAKVKFVRQIGADLAILRLDAPAVAKAAEPGQFVMLGPLDPNCMDPFLCRPLSIFRTTADGELDMLIAVVGRGTGLISAWTSGMSVELTGPLGHGFTVPSDAQRIFLVGGGVGVAPLAFLADSQLAVGRECTLLYGAASSNVLADLSWLQKNGCQIQLTTDDGSEGRHGLVTDLLSEQLPKVNQDDTFVAACGPWPMLKEVSSLCSLCGLGVQVSLENRMACGTGACMGCSLMIDGKPQRVCKQGPVFDAREVFQ